MQLGVVQPLPPLDSFFEKAAHAERQTRALCEAINALPRGAPLMLVSHQVNITALSGVYPASGEGLILALPLTVPARVLARIPPA